MNNLEKFVKEATSSTSKEEQIDMIMYLLKDAIRRIEILKQPVETKKVDDKHVVLKAIGDPEAFVEGRGKFPIK